LRKRKEKKPKYSLDSEIEFSKKQDTKAKYFLDSEIDDFVKSLFC